MIGDTWYEDYDKPIPLPDYGTSTESLVLGLPIKATQETVIKAAEQFTKQFCQQCGKCCRVVEYGIMTSQFEIAEMAFLLGKNHNDFEREYITYKRNKPHLKAPCPLQLLNMCTVYNVRPLACQLFPIHVRYNPKAEQYALAVWNCQGGNKFADYIYKLVVKLTKAGVV